MQFENNDNIGSAFVNLLKFLNYVGGVENNRIDDRIDDRINPIHNTESFWKRKVLRDFGIKKKIKSTWRSTAETLIKRKAINLNRKFDGMTYRKIIDEAFGEDDAVEYMEDLIYSSLMDMFGNLNFGEYVYHNPSPIMAWLIMINDMNEMNRGVRKALDNIMGGPISIIWMVAMIRKYKYIPAWGTDVYTDSEFVGVTSFMLADAINPIMLIQQYSNLCRCDVRSFVISLEKLGIRHAMI